MVHQESVLNEGLYLGCLQATPLISEATLVNPDVITVAPSLSPWQTFLTTTGLKRQCSKHCSNMNIHRKFNTLRPCHDCGKSIAFAKNDIFPI